MTMQGQAGRGRGEGSGMIRGTIPGTIRWPNNAQNEKNLHHAVIGYIGEVCLQREGEGEKEREG